MKSELFDLINESQDGSPLRRYLDRNVGEIPTNIGDAISALVCAALASGETADEVGQHLRYAEHEIKNARRAAEEFSCREASK
jgi:hypothetical protein